MVLRVDTVHRFSLLRSKVARGVSKMLEFAVLWLVWVVAREFAVVAKWVVRCLPAICD